MKELDESSTLKKRQCLKRWARELDLLLEKRLQLRRHFGITDVPVVKATRGKANRGREAREKPDFCEWNATEGKEGHVRLCPEVTGESPMSRVTSYHVIFFTLSQSGRFKGATFDSSTLSKRRGGIFMFLI
jgi:hypothetical protein